jgi:hypothetical protein
MQTNMKGIVFRSIAAAFFFASLCAHTKAQSVASPQQTPQPQTPVGAGTVSGLNYSSDFFGMSLTIPAGWSVYDAKGKQGIVEDGQRRLNAPDKQQQGALEAGFAQTANLFTVSKLPQGQSGPDNALLLCEAENLAGTGIKTGADYLAQMKKLIQYSTPPVPLVEEDLSTETVGGAQFGVMTLRYAGPAGAIRQKYWVIERKGYALILISTYTNEDDRQLMSRALGTIKFQ